jgi:MOSC domain-containing protein YiiM
MREWTVAPTTGPLRHTSHVPSSRSTEHRSRAELEAGLESIRRSPVTVGTLEMIVARPAVDARDVLEEGRLDLERGLVGDTWRVRGSSSTPDSSAHPDAQLTVMNARAAALVAGTADHGGLAGDQLYLDLDLSTARLPAGSRLQIGEAVIEITAKPHRGCAKFAARFGNEALRFVNTGEGPALGLRGRNAKVVVPGVIRRGDTVRLVNGAG